MIYVYKIHLILDIRQSTMTGCRSDNVHLGLQKPLPVGPLPSHVILHQIARNASRSYDVVPSLTEKTTVGPHKNYFRVEAI